MFSNETWKRVGITWWYFLMRIVLNLDQKNDHFIGEEKTWNYFEIDETSICQMQGWFPMHKMSNRCFLQSVDWHLTPSCLYHTHPLPVGKPSSKMSSFHVEHVCWTIWEHKWPATKLTRASAWLMPPWYALYSPPVSLDLTHPPQQIWQTRLHYCNVGQHSGQICKFDLQRCCLKLGMTTPQNDQWGCCFVITKNAHCP